MGLNLELSRECEEYLCVRWERADQEDVIGLAGMVVVVVQIKQA